MRPLSSPNWDLYALFLRLAMRVSFVIMRAHQPTPFDDFPQAPTVEVSAISPLITPKPLFILVLRDLYKSLAFGKLKVLGMKRYVTAL